jgi:peptide/nickel transport system ATP-binding protein
MPKGCRFHTRCPFANEKCKNEKPPLLSINQHDEHKVRCWLYEDQQQQILADTQREVHA